MDIQKNITISEDHESYTLITINVPIDMDNGPSIEEGIKEVLKTSKSNLVIDMGNTQFIFSSGMGILTRISTEANEKNKNLILVNPTEKVYQAFESVGFMRIMKIYKTKDEMEADL